MSGNKFTRVDVQVSILSAIIIICSSMCICIVNYKISYDSMLHTLTERAYSVYNYLDEVIDKDAINGINSKVDENKDTYKHMKKELANINKFGSVSYSYIAKKRDNGDVVYVVDGKETGTDSRHIGEKVESQIVEGIEKALNGETVLPKKIRQTKWGKLYIGYFPIYSVDRTIGAVGIQFDAQEQYNTFLSTTIATPIMVSIACIISILIAVKLFRRISNPSYKDVYNTDNLTDMKNRNAYDIDIKNIIARNHQIDTGIVVIDLNSLKYINDNLGHQIGDEYIRCASNALKDSMSKNKVMYRIGGDEFVAIVYNTNKAEVEAIISNIRLNLEKRSKEFHNKLSMAIGYAIYDENLDKDINHTYKRADVEMYKDKKEYYTSA